MKENLHKIFDTGKCPSADDLQLYLRGSLSPEDANLIEQHLEACELCSEAIEGLEVFDNAEKLSGITAELDARVDDLTKEEKSKLFVSGWYKIAAAVAIIFLAGGILFINNRFNKNEKIFSEHYEAYDKKEDKVLERDNHLEPAKNGQTDEPNGKGLREINTIDETDAEEIEKKLPKISKVPPVIEKKITPNVVTTDDIAVATEEEEVEVPEQNVEIAVTADGVVSEDLDASSGKLDIKGNELKNKQQELQNAFKSSADDAMIAGEVSKESNQVVSEEVMDVAISKDKAVRQQAKKASANTYSLGATDLTNKAIVQEYFDKAKLQYDNKDYVQAKQLFNQVLHVDSTHYQSLFFKALCDIELNNIGEAIDILTDLSGIKNGELYDATLWYLSLAHIKDDNPRKAKRILNKLTEIEGDYKTKAEELLNKI